jgi:pimeloyl-ACP methyl ester carboxylesterase
MASWRRVTGLAGVAAGAVAAGAGAVVAAERIAIGRVRSRRSSTPPEQLGQLRGRPLTVLADDGVPLHVEIDEPGPVPDRARRGRQPGPLTVIFCHGYTLNQDVWHFQRRDLRGHRLVFWDQRDHGRSGWSPGGAASIGRLGADLDLIIKAVAPGDLPVILVGHSMGGMTIMALADQHPDLFGSKVAGVVLISTAASGLDQLVERGRRVASDLSWLSTRFIGFGNPRVNPAVVDFLEEMIRSTPIEVVAAFGAALYACDLRATLPTLGKVPVIVMTGDKDRLIPPALGRDLAGQIPGAELVWVPGAGHALILEDPEVVNEAITGLIARVTAGRGARERSA